MIDLQNIGKQYGANRVLDNVSLSIGCGEFFVLVGPSGSGKSTLLKMLNRLIEPDCGRILLRGGTLRRRICARCGFLRAMCCSRLRCFPT